MKKDSVEYKKLLPGDESMFGDLVRLFNVEFEADEPNFVNHDHLIELLKSPNFVCFVAHNETLIMGGLTGYELKSYDKEGSTMYLYDLAVGNAFQRRGIATKLVLELVSYCKDHGIRDMFVQADVIDEHAIEFYKKLGGEISEVVHFSFDI